MTIDSIIHRLHAEKIARKLGWHEKRSNRVAVAPLVIAPAPPTGPPLEERASAIATELFAPLEAQICDSLDKLVAPEYLQDIGLSAHAQTPIITKATAQREAHNEHIQNSALLVAQKGATMQQERAELAEAELITIRSNAEQEVESAKQQTLAAKAEVNMYKAAAEEARLENQMLRGKLAEMEAKLAKLDACGHIQHEPAT